MVSPETPLFPAGGIATYVDHAIKARSMSGDDVFLLTWRYDSSQPAACDHLKEDQYEIIRIDPGNVWARRPDGPFNLAISEHLTPHLLSIIDEFGPDVIESTDYLAPLHHFLMLKRAGLLEREAARIPVVTYNHGLQWEVYRASACIPAFRRHAELAAERDVLRWSDVVLAPSRFAWNSIQRQVKDPATSSIVPEPFFWDGTSAPAENSNRFVVLGRVSFAKGIDHCIHFLNIARTLHPIDEISLVGSLPSTPFREDSVEKYILKRLHPDLHRSLNFHGSMDRSTAIQTCRSRGGFSLNFSPPETFNYAFLELLSSGLTPYVFADTAMAEFVPEHLRDILLPQNFIDRDVMRVLERTRRDRVALWEAITGHAKKLTNPQRFISSYQEALRPHVERKPNLRTRRSAGADDVTVLMASHNEVRYIEDAVQSARSQTALPAEIIILDDGSTLSAATEKLEQLSKLCPVRVVFSQANEGLCASRAKLIDLCQTKLAIFLDADDLIENSFIEKTLRAYNNSPILPNAVVSWRQNFDASTEQVFRCNWDDHSIYLANDLRMTSLIEIEALRSLGFQASMRNGEADDWDFWLRFREAGYRLICLPEPLFKYRFAPGTMSWPWSEGQAALTAELVGKRLLRAVQAGQVSDDVLIDLIAKATWQPASHQVWSAESEVLSARRIEYIGKIKSTHPVTYNVLRSIIRVSASVAKRQLTKEKKKLERAKSN